MSTTETSVHLFANKKVSFQLQNKTAGEGVTTRWASVVVSVDVGDRYESHEFTVFFRSEEDQKEFNSALVDGAQAFLNPTEESV